ncbi:hypothetical protein [Clostridium sp. LCP25S3_F8]|uniref:hypothetical protein n=1 Tax=Clostridium sp. LCP25S3_F8 TaxID=3438751 RepID=UPI003F92B214
MLINENTISNIENESITKHFLIQEICFIVGIIIIVNFNMDEIISYYSNLKIIAEYKNLILLISIISSIISPIINMVFISIVFDLILALSKINIDFKTIFKVSCIANYINLISVLINFFGTNNLLIIYIINKLNIIHFLYITVINIIILKFLKNNKVYINKGKKILFFIVSNLIWLAGVVIKFKF